MADGGHLENRQIMICISKTVWPILLKFCTMTIINPPELTSCSKIKFKKSKMVDSRHFYKLLNAISQQPFDQS